MTRPPNGAQLAMWWQLDAEAEAIRRAERATNAARRAVTWPGVVLSVSAKFVKRVPGHQRRRSLCQKYGLKNTGCQWRRLRKTLTLLREQVAP